MHKRRITVGYLCLDCRKVYKKHRYNQDRNGNWSPIEYDAVCPQCSKPLYVAGDAFKAPKTTDNKAWSRLGSLFESGYVFNRDFGSPFLDTPPERKMRRSMPVSEFRKPARKRNRG